MQQIPNPSTTAALPAGGMRARLGRTRQRIWQARWWPGNWHLLERGIPVGRSLRLRRSLPLVALVAALLVQVLLPDPVWVMVIVALGTLHLLAYLWARALVVGIDISRRREATLILAGDELEEEFVVENRAAVPLLWLEVQEGGDFPGYNVGRVISCNARSDVRWRTRTICKQRGLFQLGPLALETGDPFRLFAVTVADSRSEPVLIYPKVVHLPEMVLARGNADAEARVYRHLQGALPAPTVREHVPSEGLRHVHWPATAHHGKLMVRERQQEPAGDIWIVLDSRLPSALFERAVTFAASAAAQILAGAQRNKVGLLVASGTDARLSIVQPENGQAHIWQLLAVLARVETSGVELASLLREARAHIGTRSTLVIVTGSEQPADSVENWIAALVRGDRRAPGASVLLATTPQSAEASNVMLSLLARYDIPVLPIAEDATLPARGMIRRTRRVVKSTPTGGSYAIEIEEEG